MMSLAAFLPGSPSLRSNYSIAERLCVSPISDINGDDDTVNLIDVSDLLLDGDESPIDLARHRSIPLPMTFTKDCDNQASFIGHALEKADEALFPHEEEPEDPFTDRSLEIGKMSSITEITILPTALSRSSSSTSEESVDGIGLENRLGPDEDTFNFVAALVDGNMNTESNSGPYVANARRPSFMSSDAFFKEPAVSDTHADSPKNDGKNTGNNVDNQDAHNERGCTVNTIASDDEPYKKALKEYTQRVADGGSPQTKKRLRPSTSSSSSSPALHLGSDLEALTGEDGLKINFLSMGSAGLLPQHFGRGNHRIPHGLIGTHAAYNEQWKFEIYHERLVDDPETLNGSAQQAVVVITWVAVNLASGTMTKRTETPREASLRERIGQTICNELLHDALESRARELERSIEEARDKPMKVANIESCVKALRPRKCTMGLLFFGLLHKRVQDYHQTHDAQDELIT